MSPPAETMSSIEALREFITERLNAAAMEIFTVFEQTIVQYEKKIESQHRLLEINRNPQIKFHRAELPQHHDCRETVDFKTEPDCWDGPDPSQIKEEPEEVELQHFKQEQEEPEPLQMEEHEEPDTSQEGERLTLKFEVLEYMGQPVVQLQLLDDRSTAGEAAPPSPPSNTSVAPPDGPASQSAESNPSPPSQAEGVKPGPVNDMVIRSARPKERRVGEGIRSNLYRGVTSPLPEISALRVDEVYHDLPSDTAPLITTMAISNDVPLVDSLFGEVQEGSVLSYHMPAKKVPKTSPHSHAPCPPQLPLANYRLPASQAEASFVFAEHQKLYMSTLQTSLHQAHTIENSTKRQSSCHEWHELRRPRVTSTKFREICHYRGVTSAKNLAKRLLGPSHQTEDMKRGLDKEPVAVEEYCRLMEVNHYPCGFLIHPDAPWMGCSPGGVVFDPRGEPMFGLVEVKCPNVASYVDCPYIKISEGTETLRKSHPYYWQIQGQMLISGLDWCDFVVYAQEDMFIKRIPRDEEVTETIKEKVDSFFFNFYLPAFLEEQSK
ncbi:uncharacterized protein LOC115396857 isoform X2 [Salarias fasciatus]|uniref:Uncharacterized LOC115396857 n=1 Tax=Salarias fasciatus TaxID=181472 RepID=A0A672G3L5_SALFA|nr:uncharacterized protein LOC115396857 isoform X2 [Salarias fasciatus]